MPNGDLTIHGVRGDIVSASLENGRAMLRNCFSTQTIRIGTGGLDLMFDWAERREFTADAQIRSGNMRVLLPSETSFRSANAASTSPNRPPLTLTVRL